MPSSHTPTHSYMCTRDTQGNTATRKHGYQKTQLQGKTATCALTHTDTRLHMHSRHTRTCALVTHKETQLQGKTATCALTHKERQIDVD